MHRRSTKGALGRPGGGPSQSPDPWTPHFQPWGLSRAQCTLGWGGSGRNSEEHPKGRLARNSGVTSGQLCCLSFPFCSREGPTLPCPVATRTEEASTRREAGPPAPLTGLGRPSQPTGPRHTGGRPRAAGTPSEGGGLGQGLPSPPPRKQVRRPRGAGVEGAGRLWTPGSVLGPDACLRGAPAWPPALGPSPLPSP